MPRNAADLRAATRFARKIVEDPEYLEMLMKRARAGILQPGVEQWLLSTAYGKPAETVQVTAADDELSRMSNEELAGVARELERVLLSGAVNERMREGHIDGPVTH